MNMKPLATHAAYDHRLLNSYLQQYQEKLSLSESKNNFAVDFDEYLLLKHATEEAGFDPYT